MSEKRPGKGRRMGSSRKQTRGNRIQREEGKPEGIEGLVEEDGLTYTGVKEGGGADEATPHKPAKHESKLLLPSMEIDPSHESSTSAHLQQSDSLVQTSVEPALITEAKDLVHYEEPVGSSINDIQQSQTQMECRTEFKSPVALTHLYESEKIVSTKGHENPICSRNPESENTLPLETVEKSRVNVNSSPEEASENTGECLRVDEVQDTSVPIPDRREKRRKMGSTRKSSRRAEVQTETGEEEDVITGQEREEGKDSSLVEEELGSEITATSGEIQTEKQDEKRIHQNTDQDKENERQVGDRKTSGISTRPPEISDDSEQAEHSTFSVEKEREDKEESNEEREIEQVGTYHTPDISDYSDQAEHSTFVNEELHTDTPLTFGRTEGVGQSEAESTKHENTFEDTVILDQLNQSEDSRLTEKDSALSVMLTDTQQRSPELEDHSQQSEEGETRNVEENSPGEDSKGDVLFTLAEESGNEKIKENKEKEEERNSENGQTVISDGQSPTLLEQNQDFTTAEQEQTVKLQDTQLPLVVENIPFSGEGEINVQEGEGHQGESIERGIQPDAKDRPADTMEYEDTTLAQETALPVPARRERRRKMGSTRKSSRRAEVQTDRGEEEDVVMGQEREEGEESSLVEEELGSEITATTGEIQTEKQDEKRIHLIADEEKEMEYQVGDRESSGISAHTPEPSEFSEQAEHSTFSVEKEREDKEESNEEREMEQVGTYHTPDISDYSDQAEHSTFVNEELHTDTPLTFGRTEGVGQSEAESTKHENTFEDTVILDQLNQSEDSRLTEKDSALSVMLTDTQQRSLELEDHSQQSEEGETRNVEENSPGEDSKGDVLFTVAEESGNEKIKENKEKEEERNSENGQTVISDGQSPTLLEQNQDFTTAEQEQTVKLQDTQLPLVVENIPFSGEGEINVQEGEGHQGESAETGIQPDAKDRSTDTMEYEDTTAPQETALPVPARRERRRKMGSTRKSSRRAEVQTDRGEEEDVVMGQEREEGEESSLVEEELGSEITATSGEIQTEKQDDKRIHQNTDQDKENDESQVGDRKTSGISTYPTEVSDENMPVRCEGEINVQEGEGHQGESIERGIQPDAKDRSAETMEYEDTTLAQETALPVPARRERRRKMGSTRKTSRRAEVQADRGEEEDVVMGQEREEGEESSLLEDKLGSETGAPSGELQAEKQKEKRIHLIADEEKEMEYQVGDRESSGISAHTPEPSEFSEQAEHSTFSVENEREDKEESKEEREMEKFGTYHTPDISAYSDQAEHSPFVKEELHTDTPLTFGRTENVGQSEAESTKHENMFEDTVILDQLNQSEDSLLTEKDSALSVMLTVTQQRSLELEDHSQQSEEGETRNVEENSPGEDSKGDVLFTPGEESGNEKIKENKEKEEERNSENSHIVVSDIHSPTLLEQTQNFTTAEQVQTVKLQDTQLPLVVENIPVRCDGELNVQEGEGHQGESVERRIQPDSKDRSADTMEYKDTTLPRETALPVPARRERRRKMGSTRKSSRRAEVQTERGEEEDVVMGQEGEEGEESSLVEEELGSEITATSGEIQTEKQDDKRIHQNTDQDKENDESQVGDRKTSGISTYSTEVSDENMPVRCEGEINVQEGEGHQGESVERGIQPDSKDRSADTMEYKDTTLPQETALPVPAKTERRRKLGSTRKSTRRAEVQTEKGEEEDVMRKENSSLLEDKLGLETAAPSGELQVEQQKEKKIHLTTNQEKGMEYQVGDRESSGISAHTPEPSEVSQQAEHSTFSVEKEREDKDKSKEEREMEKFGTYHTPDILDYSDQAEHSTFVKEELHTDTPLTFGRTENVGQSEAEGTKHENMFEGAVFLYQQNQSEDSLLTAKDSDCKASQNFVSDNYSPAILEQIQDFTTAEQEQTVKLQDTQLPLVVENIPFSGEGEINVQEGEGHQGERIERGIQPDAKDRPADTLEYEDTTLPQETSLPVPARRERRRKMGSTRKSSRRAEVQADRGEEEDVVMGQEREEGEESSLVEEELGSEITATSREIQTEKQDDKRIHQNTDQDKEYDESQVGDSKTSGISTYPTEVSDENMSVRCEGKISVQEEEGHQGQSDKRGAEAIDKSADIMMSQNTSLPQDTSLPVPNRRERRRKLGSTRKSSRKAEAQTETGEEEDVMGQEREEDKESSLLDKGLGSEIAAPSDEMHAEKLKEMNIHQATEHSTFSVEKERSNKEEREEREMEQVGMYHTPDISNYSAQVEHSFEKELASKNVVHHSADEHDSSAVPHRRRKMGSTRKGLLRSANQGEGEQLREQREKTEGEKGEMGEMLEGNDVNDTHKEEKGIDKDEALEREIMSSVQSPPFLEPPESSAVAGKQDKASPGVKKKLGSRRKGRSTVWKGDRDLGQANEMGVEEDSKASAVLQRIQEVFHHWDPEEKGFITWDHMQGLSGELGLSVEELRQVFDRLDKDRDGLVTPEDVTAGFREFMQLQQPRARPAAAVYQSDGSILPEEEDDGERKLFLSKLGDLRAYSLLQDQSDIWRLWVELQHNEPHLLNILEDFVSNVTEQIKTVQQEKDSLELALKRHIQQHSVGVKELYEEMERQIRTEKERIKEESLEKSRSQLAKLEEELDQKNSQIQTLNAVQSQLEGRLHALQRQQQQTGVEKQELFRANQELEEQLERIRAQLQESLSNLHALRSAHPHKPTHPHLLSLTDRAGQTEDSSRPEVLNLDSNVQTEKRDISHEAVVLERSGSQLDHSSPQGRCTGAQDEARRRVISIEEDPMPDLLTGGQALPYQNQGEALWEKQRGQAWGERDSLSSVSHSPSALDLLYNVVLVGNSSVGKTCFMKRFQSGDFNPDLCATVGLDSCIQTMQVEGRKVILQLWDTAGQERYHSITKQILRKAQGLVLMYDITSSESFLALRSWLSSIQEGAPDDVIIVLLGNKNDSHRREVSLEEGERLAREYSVHFMECSAATGDNVVQAMNNLARMLKQQVEEKQESSITLHKGSPKKKSGCCG
ncbi:trichohyalin-like isoform X2 [Anguilla rostrata]|uniref:trichohyalin-like isoform X2 n=1 Tax=Anguilla rostrata TaxID=7938 RepID=UPI0030D55578